MFYILCFSEESILRIAVHDLMDFNRRVHVTKTERNQDINLGSWNKRKNENNWQVMGACPTLIECKNEIFGPNRCA